MVFGRNKVKVKANVINEWPLSIKVYTVQLWSI